MSEVLYAEDHFTAIESKQDDCPPYGQGQDGYGRKIAMPYLVRLNKTGPWRRVYCVIFSNSGSLYIIVKKQSYYFQNAENLRLTGEWTQEQMETSKKYLARVMAKS